MNGFLLEFFHAQKTNCTEKNNRICKYYILRGAINNFYFYFLSIFRLKATRQKQNASIEFFWNLWSIQKLLFSWEWPLSTGPRRSFPRRPFIVITCNYSLELLKKVNHVVPFCTDKYCINTCTDYTNYSKTKFANLLIFVLECRPPYAAHCQCWSTNLVALLQRAFSGWVHISVVFRMKNILLYVSMD